MLISYYFVTIKYRKSRENRKENYKLSLITDVFSFFETLASLINNIDYIGDYFEKTLRTLVLSTYRQQTGLLTKHRG